MSEIKVVRIGQKRMTVRISGMGASGAPGAPGAPGTPGDPGLPGELPPVIDGGFF